MENNIEYWLSGPVEGIPYLLQPVAHALLQSRREVAACTKDFPLDLLWKKINGMASVGFHLQHLTGVLDRLLTYARGEQLTEAQLAFLKSEGVENNVFSVEALTKDFEDQVDMALKQLSLTEESSLLATRFVGRKQIPSTVLGLLFHSAEHSMRHTGQLLVSVKVLTEK